VRQIDLGLARAHCRHPGSKIGAFAHCGIDQTLDIGAERLWQRLILEQLNFWNIVGPHSQREREIRLREANRQASILEIIIRLCFALAREQHFRRRGEPVFLTELYRFAIGRRELHCCVRGFDSSVCCVEFIERSLDVEHDFLHLAIEEQVGGDELVQREAGGGVAPSEIDQVVVERQDVSALPGFQRSPMVWNQINQPLIPIVALRTDDRVVRSTRFAGGGCRCYSRTPCTSGRRIVCQRIADQVGQSDALGAGWSIRKHCRFRR